MLPAVTAARLVATAGERDRARRREREAVGQEEPVRDRVLESDGDEGGDREHDREDLVGDAARADREPHREADERVAQHAAEEALGCRELRLRLRDRDRGLADGAAAQRRGIAADDQRDGGQAAGDVARVGEHPVADDLARADEPARPCHRDQVVAGEELGAGHDDQDEPEAARGRPPAARDRIPAWRR